VAAKASGSGALIEQLLSFKFTNSGLIHCATTAIEGGGATVDPKEGVNCQHSALNSTELQDG